MRAECAGQRRLCYEAQPQPFANHEGEASHQHLVPMDVDLLPSAGRGGIEPPILLEDGRSGHRAGLSVQVQCGLLPAPGWLRLCMSVSTTSMVDLTSFSADRSAAHPPNEGYWPRCLGSFGKWRYLAVLIGRSPEELRSVFIGANLSYSFSARRLMNP